jgi:hypothetical protein
MPGTSAVGDQIGAARHRSRTAHLSYNRRRLHSTLKLQTLYETRVRYRPPIAPRGAKPVPDPGVEGTSDLSGGRRSGHATWPGHGPRPVNRDRVTVVGRAGSRCLRRLCRF